MPYSMRELTDVEKETFLTENHWGTLSFTGDEVYAIPMGYQYEKGTVLLGFQPRGRKMDYINKNRNVCFNVCRPAKQTIDSKEAYPYTSVIIEGELEEYDRSQYGLEPLPEGVKLGLYRIKPKRVGTQKMDFTP